MTTLIKLTSAGKPCVVNAAAYMDKQGYYTYTSLPGMPGRVLGSTQLIKVGDTARFKTDTAEGVCVVLDVNHTAMYPIKVEFDVPGLGKRIDSFKGEDLREWVQL